MMAAPLAPATAAEFTALGVAPAEAAMLAAQHEAMAGRSGYEAKAAMMVAATDAPPPVNAAPVQSTITKAEAVAALGAHNEAQLSTELAATFAPPASPFDYRLPMADRPSDEDLAADTALRTAVHSEGLPRFMVESIATSVLSASRALRAETEAQYTARVNDGNARLDRMWGDQAATNRQAVADLLAQMSARSPALREWIDAAGPYLGPLDLDQLAQFARHRSVNR